MVKIVRQAGQKCTLNKPLYCPKNGEHLNYFLDKTKRDKVKQLEKKIDYLIFELYNLTSEEIALVEGICHGK